MGGGASTSNQKEESALKLQIEAQVATFLKDVPMISFVRQKADKVLCFVKMSVSTVANLLRRKDLFFRNGIVMMKRILTILFRRPCHVVIISMILNIFTVIQNVINITWQKLSNQCETKQKMDNRKVTLIPL